MNLVSPLEGDIYHAGTLSKSGVGYGGDTNLIDLKENQILQKIRGKNRE